MIVLDASVAAKWILDEPGSAQALSLLQDALTASEPIVAPALLRSEITNIVWQSVRRGTLDTDGARTRLDTFLALPIRLRFSAILYRDALSVAERYNLPAAYDAQYIALAERLGAILWTADTRLLRTPVGSLPFVRLLSS